MKRDVASRDRAHAIRAAARAWKRSKLVDEAALGRIDALYPDEGVRSKLPMRVLVFLFTALAGVAGFFLLCFPFALGGGDSFPAVSCLYALGLCALTEWQQTRLRRMATGSETATGLGAVAFAAGALTNVGPDLVLFLGVAVVAIGAAWRWGTPLLGATSALATLAAVHEAFRGSLVIAATGAAIFAVCWPQSVAGRHPPSVRKRFAEAWIVGLVSVYVALNRVTIDGGFFTSAILDADAGGGLRLLGTWATALLPPLVLLLGVRLRDARVLVAGVAFATASLATVHSYVPVLPAWLALAGGGCAAIVAALALRRWLDASPGRERRGFTAEPLDESSARLRVAETAVTLAAMTPSGARTEAIDTFEGGGGESGGGGASGGY